MHKGDPSATLTFIKTLGGTAACLTRFLKLGLAMMREYRLREAYNRGIQSLPVEIMERILEFAYDPRDEGWKSLLLVNRYFRDVTYRTSLLWTAVSTNRDPTPYLERSASRGLLVSVRYFNERELQFERWIAAIDPHWERWKSFSIGMMPFLCTENEPRTLIGDPKTIAHRRLRDLRDTYKGRTFPSLETLSVSYGVDVPVDPAAGVMWQGLVAVLDNSSDPHASVRNFFSTWHMPALRNLEMVGLIPILPQGCASSITRFDLVLGKTLSSNYLLYSLRVISDFLRGLTSLQELHLNLDTLKVFLEDEIQPVELSHLKTLAIHASFSFMTALGPLIRSVSAPELRELMLKVVAPSAEEAEMFMNHLFPSSRPRFERLEKLSCSVVSDDDDDEMVYCGLDCLFGRLPRLQHLAITNRSGRWPRNFALHEHFRSPDCLVPPLRTLCFDNCEKLNMTFILKCLRDIIRSAEFETLEIHNCPRVNTEIVRKAMPKGKELESTEFDWCTSHLIYSYILS